MTGIFNPSGGGDGTQNYREIFNVQTLIIADNLSMAGNSSQLKNVNLQTYNGWSPLILAEPMLDNNVSGGGGSGSSGCFVFTYYMDRGAGKIYVGIRNTASSTAKIRVRIRLVLVKNGE